MNACYRRRLAQGPVPVIVGLAGAFLLASFEAGYPTTWRSTLIVGSSAAASVLWLVVIWPTRKPKYQENQR